MHTGEGVVPKWSQSSYHARNKSVRYCVDGQIGV